MSAPVETAPAAATGRWRRHRSTLLVAAGLVLGVVVVLVLGGGSASTIPLDPANKAPDGAQALARVLDDQGVDVEVVRSADALDDADVDAGTTVLVTSTDNLGASTVDRLRDRTSEALLVLTAPGPAVTEAFGVEAGGASTSDDARPADCVGSDLVDLLEGLEVRTGEGAEYPAPSGCFYGENGALVAQPTDGVVLLGAVDVLRNGGVLEADNAAVALRLLGQHDRLVWYVPDVADLAADDAVTLSSLLPDWLRPGLWLVALALLALVFWRGRRLGPLATEPLPVVVRAIETTRSRGPALPSRRRPRPRRGHPARGRSRSRGRPAPAPGRRAIPTRSSATSPGTWAGPPARWPTCSTRTLPPRPPTRT